MSLWKIAWRSIQQRGLSSFLTAFSMGLGVALVVAVLVIHGVVDRSFRRGAQGYDLIVGAKGGKLQLVLNTVFYLSEPIETIPYSVYEYLKYEYPPEIVEAAIPICMGDNFKGYQIIGTDERYFRELTYMGGQPYRFAQGDNFTNEDFFSAVVGSTVAHKTGLQLGDQFAGSHGVERGGHEHAERKFTVVGILEHTGTPNDRAVFVNMEGFLRQGEHLNLEMLDRAIERGAEKYQDLKAASTKKKERYLENIRESSAVLQSEYRDLVDLTAVLVLTNQDKPEIGVLVEAAINNQEEAQAVAPAQVITELFDGIVGNVQLVLLILAVFVVVVASIGLLVSIYNTMNERRHEIAIMRALGAGRVTVMLVVLLESILLSLGGGALGLLLGHGLVGVFSPTIAEQTGVNVGALQFQLIELILVPGLIVLASLVGFLPAAAAYRTDVAKALVNTP